MTDRFKFRVWDKKNSEYVPEGEMGDVHCLLHRDGTLDCGVAYDDGYAGGIDWVETEGAVIEQCTGLKDKNGKLIFEGDVVVLVNGATHPITVLWDGIGWKFIRNGKRIEYAYESDIMSDISKCEIIGNIHDVQIRDATKMMEGDKC